MNTLNFNDCTLTYLEDTFGIRRHFNSTSLNQWISLAENIPLNNFEQQTANSLQNLLFLNVENWNENELSMQFIGPVFSLINFTEPYHFNLFAQRSIEGIVQGIKLNGKPDGIIASGYGEPKRPFFSFQEYKKQRDPNGDPAGQCLAAMLTGQSYNETADEIIYGAYVIGRDWYFMTLKQTEYTISNNYSATTQQLHGILQLLKALKQIIVQKTANLS